jgi:hypothetical protein
MNNFEHTTTSAQPTKAITADDIMKGMAMIREEANRIIKEELDAEIWKVNKRITFANPFTFGMMVMT